ncbi:MAG: hypothetical protein OEZ65_05090 [Gemmatimonadota bacterium]|nr:hypothetical protein [Gemmatimonadota bacterium]
MMASRRGLLLAVMAALALSVGACATTKPQNSSNPDLLTQEEIMGAGARNLHEVVQRLRPRWLRARAADRSFGSSVEIVVYQNQTFLGNTETLAQISPSMAYEMRWLDGTTAAATLPGLGSGRIVAGAIVIKTQPPGS